MKTLWDKELRDNLQTRLDQLDANKHALWGRFDCPRMLAHTADGLRMALGHMTVASKNTPLRYWPIKQLVIYLLPFPKGAPTAPELLSRSPETIDNERKAIVGLIEEFADRNDQDSWPDHPAFGRLNAKSWGVLMYKHIDHHLRQFGV